MQSTVAEEAVREVKEAMAALEPGGRGKASLVDGIGIVEEPKRFYPNRELAASLLGFTNRDCVGIEGVELAMDNYLRGERSHLFCERDARGRLIVPAGAEVDVNSKGHSVMLTIDRNIQHIAEKELQAVVDKYRAREGIVLVLSPKTGEVLAMATVPSFNPNTPSTVPAEVRRNRPLTDSYEPGSTFKVFTLASALEMGTIRGSEKFFCENGSYVCDGRVIRDTRKHGWLDVRDIMKYSSNIGVIKINEHMNVKRFYDMILAFGFGARTGIELKGEMQGIIPSREDFDNRLRRATVSFGQGISVTPLQLATGMSAVINGGKMMKPYIVREIRDPEGNTVYRGKPQELRRVLSPKTSGQMREILGGVVHDGGTGAQAMVKGFLVGGKTGTSQKVEPGKKGYSPDKRIASFIGFLPLHDPELLILVVIDEPRESVYGSVVAAPAFNQIAAKTAYYLGIQPTESIVVAKSEQSGKTGPNEALFSAGSVPVTTVSMTTSAGPMIMPDLTGLSMGRVIDVMNRYPVQMSMKGSGIARSQTPAPGVVLSPGAKCSVQFAQETVVVKPAAKGEKR